MMKKIYILAASLLGAASCSFLDVQPEVITRESFYTSRQELLYGLAGVYGVISNEGFYGNYYSLMLSNTDDLCYYNRATASNNSVWYRHDATSQEIYSAWTEIYQGVNNANVFMDAVAESEFDTDHAYYNEARFLRAFYHFILAQAWGDVPLRDTPIITLADETNCSATPQLDVLKWVAGEMEECLYFYGQDQETGDGSDTSSGEADSSEEEAGSSVPEDVTAPDPVLASILASQDLSDAPSRVVPSTMCGILSRVYLFMAGESVSGTTDDDKHEYFGKAMKYAKAVIDCGKHTLNPDYSQIFINMISDKYDKEYNESMWEADFLGNRSSSDSWSNGRIGDLIGLQSSADVGTYDDVNCNYAYGQYNGSLKLWELYWSTDRTDEENEIGGESNLNKSLPDFFPGESVPEDYVNSWAENGFLELKDGVHWDKRQFWNMCPYNYAGGTFTASGTTTEWSPGIDRTPYRVSPNTTETWPSIARGVRNCGKYRRETEYEGVKGDRGTYTPINYPILRYADVLLMYAEASNEYYGAPDQTAYDCIKEVRDRAGISTRPFSEYSSQDDFRQFVRNERGRELCFESLRKYDLIRWGIFVESMKGYLQDTQDPNWGGGNTSSVAYNTASAVQSRHVVLPIPSIELGVNSALEQNPLW